MKLFTAANRHPSLLGNHHVKTRKGKGVLRTDKGDSIEIWAE